MKRTLSLDLRYAAAAVLAGVAALIVLGVTSPPDRVPILIAETPLPDGVPLAELNTARRWVEDPTGLIEAPAATAFGDHVLRIPLAEGEPLLESNLQDPSVRATSDIIGLDLKGAAAVQGRLLPGDRVDVYAAGPEARLIAPAVPVIAVERATSRLGLGDVHLLLAVDGDLPATLIAAASSDSIHLVQKGA